MKLPRNLSVMLGAVILVLTACSGASDNAAEPDPAVRAEQDAVDGQAVNSSSPETDGDFVIVMLGDSLTAGYGLAEADAPPAQIEERLRAQDFAVRVVNAGVSGDTTAGGLARYEWSVAGATPDLLVIALGANDYLGGVAPERASENLEAIIAKAKADNLPFVLVGLQARTTADSRDRAYGAIYPALAKKHKAPLYPAMLAGVRGNPGLLQADGLHPTAAGAELVADNLTEFLAPVTRELLDDG